MARVGGGCVLRPAVSSGERCDNECVGCADESVTGVSQGHNFYNWAYTFHTHINPLLTHLDTMRI